jgi:hypothetical protein
MKGHVMSAVRALVVASSVFALAPAAFAAERSYALSGFDQVASYGAVDAEITVGPAYKVVLIGETQDLDKVEVLVDGKKLVLRPKRGNSGWSNSGDIRAKISMPALNSVSVAGSGDVVATGVKANDFNASIAGSGDIRVAGSCATANLSIAGSGDLRFEELRCKSVNASIAGSGDIRAYASESANSRIAGSGDIAVLGAPKDRNTRVMGSGTISYPAGQ